MTCWHFSGEWSVMTRKLCAYHMGGKWVISHNQIFVCFFGDSLQILPWDSSPLFPTIWENMFFELFLFHPTSRTSKELTSMRILLKLRKTQRKRKPKQDVPSCQTNGSYKINSLVSGTISGVYDKSGDPSTIWPSKIFPFVARPFLSPPCCLVWDQRCWWSRVVLC